MIILKGGKAGLLPEIQFGKNAGNISLSVIKNISLSLDNKVYPNDPTIKSNATPQIDQSMRLNLHGVVADRLNILIKYDDTNKQDWKLDQNISLKYLGKSGEILNYIEAGNINLALPGTQFVSYSKNFFGIKGKIIFEDIPIIPGKLEIYPILGISQNKVATNTINPNANGGKTPHTYYDGSYVKDSIFVLNRLPDTATRAMAWDENKKNFLGKYEIDYDSLSIYFDDRNFYNNTELTVDDGAEQGGNQIFHFDQLLKGVDYTINTKDNLLYFKKTIPSNGILIGAFKVKDAISGSESYIVGNPDSLFIDDDGNGFFDDGPIVGTDDDNDGFIDEDPIDGIDNDGDGQIDEDPADLWYDGASTPTVIDGYKNGFTFIKSENNRYSGNALQNFYRTGITDGKPLSEITGHIINTNDADGDNDNKVFTTSTNERISYLTIFGLDVDPIDGNIDQGILDNDNGYLIFPDATPFDLTDNDSTTDYLKAIKDGLELTDSELNEIISKCSNKYIYAKNDSLEYSYSASHNIFQTVIEYASPQLIYNLQQNVKEGSVVVTVGGTPLKLGTDYTVDYRIGILTITNKDKIAGNVKIEIKYEYEPFFADKNKYVLGARNNWQISKNFTIGATVVNENYFKSKTIMPEIGAEPQSKFVFDINGSLNITKDFQKKLFSNIPLINKVNPQKITFSGEYAYAYNNPNTLNKTALDSLDNTKDPTNIAFNYKGWYLSSLPLDIGDENSRAKTICIEETNDKFTEAENDFSFYSFTDSDRHPYTPDAQNTFTTQTPPTTMQFWLNSSNKWGGIEKTISSQSMDISKKSTLDFWIKNMIDIPVNAVVHIEIGMISEDSDGDNVLDTEDTNHDGLPNIDEDTGITFNNGVFTSILGKGDNKQQSEDLDRDGILDTANRYYAYSTDILKNYDFGNGWQFISIPLNINDIANQRNTPTPTNVKYVRIWVENNSSSKINFKIQDLEITGNKWEKGFVENGSASEYLTVSDISQDDPKFASYFDTSDDMDKGAFMLDYYLVGTSTDVKSAFTYQLFPLPKNISSYKTLEISTIQYETISDSDTDKLYFQLGIDQNNYWKIPLKKPKPGYNLNDWYINNIDLNDLEKFEKIGNPNLLNVKYIGFLYETNSAAQGKILLNNIYLADPTVLKGTAYRGSMSTNLLGLGAFTGNYSVKSSDFSPLGVNRSGYNTANFSSSLQISKLRWMPVSLGYSRGISNLMSIVNYGSNSSNTKSENETLRISTNLNLNQLFGKLFPSLSYSYSNTNNDIFGTINELEKKKSMTLSEAHTFAMRLQSFLFILKSLNITGARNINIAKYNTEFDSTLTNKTTLRNNLGANFTIKFLKLLNSISYNDSYENDFKQNDNISYSVSSNVPIIKFILEPNLKIEGKLNRIYIKDNETSDISSTSVKFSTSIRLTNRISFSRIFKKFHLLGVNSINLNITYNKNNDSSISAYENVFPIEKILDILKDKINEDMYRNLTDRDTLNLSFNYAPFRFINLSGNYSLNISNTKNMGSSLTLTTKSINGNAAIMGIDKLIKFLKRTTLTLGMGYRLSRSADADLIQETYSPSLSFPIYFSNKFSQSLRAALTRNMQTRFGIETTTADSLTLTSNWKYTWNLQYGVKLPFIKNKIKLKNAVNTNLGISYAMVRSDVINSTESNSFTINGGFDYRMSRYFVLNSNIMYKIYNDLTVISRNYNEFKLTVGGNIIF
ncbi:hypothetical protein J7L48_11115 [bacterium]|nr:hypothetical protein [bacterium]